MPTPTDTPARRLVNPPAEWLHAHRRSIFAVMLIGWAMSMLDASIVNIAIPELQRSLEADVATASWVINAYNIAFAVLLVPMGRLADQFGRRRMFVAGMVVFTAGSALCAASPTIGTLIAARAIQGAGAGMLAPLGFAIAVLVFPPERRGFGLSLIAVAALVANASGPLLGGALIELAGWWLLFLVNVPVGVVAIALARRWWPETFDPDARQGIDWLGMVLLTAAVGCLIFALVQANGRGWTDVLVLWLLQLALVLGAGFWASQRYGRAPMLPPDLVGERRFRSANLAMLLFAAGFMGSLLMLSLVFIDLWGYTPLEAGLALTPMPVAGLLAWPIAGRTAGRVPAQRVAVPALAVVAIGLVWLSLLPALAGSAIHYLTVLPGLIVVGLGMGVAFPAINVGAMSAVPPPRAGAASGVLNTARQLGGALGVAILVAVVLGVGAIFAPSLRADVEDLARDYAIPNERAHETIERTLRDFYGQSPERLDPIGFDERVADRAAETARDGYAWAFRVAALLTLLALWCARRMGARRAPAPAAGQASVSSASTTRSAARPSP